MSLTTEIKKEKDPVRRDHLQRQLAGTAAIDHMTNKVDEKKEARIRLTDEVSKIGKANRLKAEVDGKRALAKAKVKAAGEAKKKAEAAKKQAKQAEIESVEFNELAALKQRNADLEAENMALKKGK
ncbi:MAG: hypothetical protein GY749_22750 [Desulfobacteraceae bacterium]|nr:hypothetical protein [Desulfobacteraceae bacterium]